MPYTEFVMLYHKAMTSDPNETRWRSWVFPTKYSYTSCFAVVRCRPILSISSETYNPLDRFRTDYITTTKQSEMTFCVYPMRFTSVPNFQTWADWFNLYSIRCAAHCLSRVALLRSQWWYIFFIKKMIGIFYLSITWYLYIDKHCLLLKSIVFFDRGL